MSNCTDCSHSKFNEELGMYECRVFQHVIYILLDASECPRYELLKGENYEQETGVGRYGEPRESH